MITRQQLARRAAEDGVSGQTVERDYVLTAILVGLSQDQGAEKMVFKGGTALRACYFLDYRYSADLDFSLVGGMTVEDGFQSISGALERIGPAAGLSEAKLEVSGRGSFVRFVGPLGRQSRIKVDLSNDELVVNTASLELLRRYDDFSHRSSVRGYTADEIGAEKLRCVLQRKQCRDPYDLHYLLTNAGIDVGEVHLLFRRKSEHKGLDSSRLPEKLDELLEWCKPRWTEELREYVRDVPRYAAFERELRRALRPVLR